MSKAAVHDFWNEASCGEKLFLGDEDYDAQAAARYRQEPFILSFARFDECKGLRVLEIGVGLGADHERFAHSGADLTGIDLTQRAIEHSRRRLARHGLRSDLQVGDAENLPFPDSSFDLVYSWGVIHHSPDTARAAAEILRVLKPGGRYAVMIYHKWSLVGLMLWLRYRERSLAATYARHLESPGTRAFTRAEARRLFPGARVWTELSSGDLLEGGAGQRHEGRLLGLARRIWPRFLLRRLRGLGLFLLIEGRKPA